MRAALVKEHGGIENFFVSDLPIPSVGNSEVLVALKAASLNHIDIWIRKGIPGISFGLPHTLGSDGSGVVADIGRDVTSVRVGDAVVIYPAISCGRCEFCLAGEDSMCVAFSVIGEQRDGTFAEHVSVPERCIFLKPKELSFDEAAATPLVFLTAWRMLVTRARIKPGDSVLIVGIGGGVAGAAFQIAKLVGCRIIVTSGSSEKLEKAKKLGAHECINHNERDFSQEVRRITGKRGVDVAVESVGGNVFQKSLLSLAKGGKLVTCGATAGPSPSLDIARVFWNHLAILGSTLGNRREFIDLLKAVETQGLRPIIDSVYPLEMAREAQLRMEEGAQFGKIVLRTCVDRVPGRETVRRCL